MKFSNGFWMNKEGVNIYSPAEARDIEIDEKSITVYAPHNKIWNRGQTLGGPLLTIKYSSPFPDVIRVQAFHYKGSVRKGPEFELYGDAENDIKVLNNENEAVLMSGNLSVKIGKKKEWNVEYIYKDKLLTSSRNKHMGYITAESHETYMREQLSLGIGECVYGLGERFSPFVKNGQAVDIWNEDGGTCSEQAYKNIPFYITNRGYGVFVNHTGCVSFEVASEVVSRVQFSVPGECIEYYIIGGASLKEVLQNYTSLTGKPALPPAWSFGLWLTTSFTTNYDEETVNSFIDGMAQRDLPLHVFHFDCFWMKEFQWCDFEWDRSVFPDIRNMLRRLKAKGLKISVWINPYIAQKSKLFDEALENGYLLKKQNGDVWQWDMWQPGMGIVDFTNPEACKWYGDKLKNLVDIGVDCFKTDFGERIPTDVVYYDGSDPVNMHNYYSYLYNKIVFKALNDKCGEGNAVLFARSATAGGQKFPVHWGGDCVSKYESMAETLRGGLSLCLCGFGFWSHDIGGFEQTASADVYKRWVAFGLLSTHSRLHGNSSYRVPWLYDEEAVDVLRFFTKLKCRLMPYLYNAACTASKEGIPVMRAMMLEFESDPACDYVDRQYMLGDSLLVAPVFSADGNVTYYLPDGIWTSLLNSETVEGGYWRNENHSYMSIPLMVRSDSIIALGNIDNRPDYDYADGVTLYVYNLQDGHKASATVNNKSGSIELEVIVMNADSRIIIEAHGVGKPWSICFKGLTGVKSVNGGSVEPDEGSIKIIPYSYTGVFEVLL